MTGREIDTANIGLVSARGGLVYTGYPAGIEVMTPHRALVHAAWLVVVASTIDPQLPPFGDVLAAVKNALAGDDVVDAEIVGFEQQVVQMEAQRAAVLAIHEVSLTGVCSICLDGNDDTYPWPCPTLQALGVTG